MAQDVVINGTTYPAVESVALSDADGNVTMYYPDAVRYNPQTLTDEQKAQARENIGVEGIHIGSEPPTDVNVKLWVDTDEESGGVSGGGGGLSVVSYKNVTKIPLTNGAQYIFYQSDEGTVTITIGIAKTTINTPKGGCFWALWAQTADTAGSLISTNGTRTYMEAGTIPETMDISYTDGNACVVIKIG